MKLHLQIARVNFKMTAGLSEGKSRRLISNRMDDSAILAKTALTTVQIALTSLPCVIFMLPSYFFQNCTLIHAIA